MPSDRKQLNVRVDPDVEDLVEQLIPAVTAALGVKVSQSDLFRLGMKELAAKYLPPAGDRKRRPARG